MTFKAFWQPLAAIYGEDEARWIGREVFLLRYGLSQTALLMGEAEHISEAELKGLQQRLLEGEPVQYVVGETEFCGHRFHTAHGVLIPRPETEELCRWIVEEWKEESGKGKEESGKRKEESGKRKEESGKRLLDIGTGSGCIACTLAAELKEAQVGAWDISADALRIARGNAERLGVSVNFELVDALQPPHPTPGSLDIIVSNPPYVCQQERADMERHVLDHEPPLALFVPDDDPLLFYRAIADYALQALRPGGRLYFELNCRFAHETADMLQQAGFSDVCIRKDQYGKDRFISACR